MAVKPTFSGEVQFAGYSDSSRGGPRITLRLADRVDLDKFIGCEGKRYMAVMVEIMDDETPAVETVAEPQKKPAVKRERMPPLCEWAVMACADESFQRWSSMQQASVGMNQRLSPDEASKEFILKVCGVTSRKFLDTTPEAAKALHEKVRKPYAAWLEKMAFPA